jgi:integrase
MLVVDGFMETSVFDKIKRDNSQISKVYPRVNKNSSRYVNNWREMGENELVELATPDRIPDNFSSGHSSSGHSSSCHSFSGHSSDDFSNPRPCSSDNPYQSVPHVRAQHSIECAELQARVLERGKIIDFPIPPTNSNYVDNSRKGGRQEVFPLKRVEDIQAISRHFASHRQYRDLLIFTLGINIGLRAGDLLSLKVDDVLNSDNGVISDGITVREEKTSKHRTFFLNQACRDAISWYMEVSGISYEPGDYLFKSREGGHVEVDTFRKILKDAAKECGIKQNIGTHTLRKTFGYHQFTAHSGDIRNLSLLQRMFGHSSQATTLRYIGISEEEDKQMYNDVSIQTINL